MAKENEQMQINNDLLNAITPFGGIDFLRNKLYIGEVPAKIYGIVKYPPSLSRGWASKLTNLSNTIMCQTFEPCDNGALINDLSASVARYNGIANSTRDALERQRAEKASMDAESIMRQIDENGEVIGYMSNFALVSGRDDEELERACRKFEGAVAIQNCKSRVLVNQMKEAFKTVSPYNVPQEEVLKLTRRNVPMSTFIEGFPFASNNFVDITGYPIGRNTENGLVALDPWVRSGDRTNSNIILLGVLGVGKSSTVKQLMISEFMCGTTNIVIDFEREYVDLTRNLDGDVINAGGGNNIINPLQFKEVPTDDDEDDIKLVEASNNGLNPMALHFKNLEVFFRLYQPGITNRQLALLKQVLEKVYNEFGMTWTSDVSDLKNTDYPILTDLYNMFLKLKTNDEIICNKEDFAELEAMARELAIGSDSFIWNGHTSVEANTSFICFDASSLMETSDNIKKAQYYNLLAWSWEKMSRDRDEKVMLWCDEAYIIVDPKVPEPLIYLRNMTKRGRKYNAGICTVFHTVTELLDPSVRLYAQPLLDMPTYKVVMGCDGKNLDDLAQLYNLSEQEIEIVAKKKRGQSLFFVGSRRFSVTHEISQYEFDLMGTGDGK